MGYLASSCGDYDSYMLGQYGGGRGRVGWAEKIAKKYLWIAMNQLASGLHDNVERKRERWDPEPLRPPLVLLEERKMDPTVEPAPDPDQGRDHNPWWIPSRMDFSIGRELDDSRWVAAKEDLPTLETILTPNEREGQRWLLLECCPSWSDRSKDEVTRSIYRHAWIHVQAYLVPIADSEMAFRCLHRRNFFGRWMPDGATWLYGFAGEYPWATPFNTEPEEWHGMGGEESDYPVRFIPASSDLLQEWQYDATRSGNSRITVPARRFFSLNDLWWDGNGGFQIVGTKGAFLDPSVLAGGPSALLADVDDLVDRLAKLNLSLVWTCLGEKTILGGRADSSTPRRTFSQMARLKPDGIVEYGDRVFFEDYNQDASPLRESE